MGHFARNSLLAGVLLSCITAFAQQSLPANTTLYIGNLVFAPGDQVLGSILATETIRIEGQVVLDPEAAADVRASEIILSTGFHAKMESGFHASLLDQSLKNELINEFGRSAAYGIQPNPFTTKLELTCKLTSPASVGLVIRNSSGQVVQSLESRVLPEGVHVFNPEVETLPSGVYFYQLQIGNQINAGKLIKL